LAWLDMELRRTESGAPHLVLDGDGKRFAERNGVREVLVSLSHSAAWAVANAVAVAEEFT
jgi:holo-[acyl-carrier protein] synthase